MPTGIILFQESWFCEFAHTNSANFFQKTTISVKRLANELALLLGAKNIKLEFRKIKTNKIICLPIGLLILFSICMLVLGFCPNSFSEEVFLSSDQTLPIFLKPTNPMVEVPFEIDNSPYFLVDIACPTDLFIVL